MNRADFLNEILPNSFKITTTHVASGPDSLKVYNNKPKDILLIKRTAREKINKNGAPILYYPIDPNSISNNNVSLSYDNALKDHTDINLGAPIKMIATWTPQEYQIDLSKWGVMMPSGSDQQIYIHVDELTELLHRKPLIGDIIETILDKTRYKVADVFYGNINLWENIFCMLTLSKTTYDNYTQQLDQYDEPGESYVDTYTQLSKVLDVMTGKEEIASNKEIKEIKKRTNSLDVNKPVKRSIDVASLDLMTMKL